MEHTLVIMSKLKEKNEDGKSLFKVEDRIKLTEKDIEELALQKFKDSRYSLNNNREYYAELEETKHS